MAAHASVVFGVGCGAVTLLHNSIAREERTIEGEIGDEDEELLDERAILGRHMAQERPQSSNLPQAIADVI